MNETLQSFPGSADAGAVAAQRNRVLRNTYWLLALSMVPTVLGAWVGVQSGLMRAMSPGISMIVFLVGAFGLMYAILLSGFLVSTAVLYSMGHPVEASGGLALSGFTALAMGRVLVKLQRAVL